MSSDKNKGAYRTNTASGEFFSSDDESDAGAPPNTPNAQRTPSNNAVNNQSQASNTQPVVRQLTQSTRQQMQAQAAELEKQMEALELRQQQLDQIRQQQQQNASLQRPPPGQSSIFNQSVPAKSFNFDQSTNQQRPPQPFSFGPALPLPSNFSSIFNAPSTSGTNQNATVQRQNRFSFASSRLPSTSSETSTNNFSPQTPNVVKRQPPNANAPIRTTERSQTPANSLIIYSKIKAVVKAAKVSVVSAEGHDTVCFVQLSQTNVLVKFRSDMRLAMGYNLLSPFLRQQVADYGVEIASVYGIYQPAVFDRDGWAAFLRQTVDVTFSGYWVKTTILPILGYFSKLQFCYFKNIDWPDVWMNELRRHLPMVAVLYVDARQSANSTFLSCFKHLTLCAHERQHRYVNLILHVTDFPTGVALDDYLVQLQQYVEERVLILVSQLPDDAFLRILRRRSFNCVSTAQFFNEYIFFELQIQNVFITIGFLKPSNDTAMPSSRQQQ